MIVERLELELHEPLFFASRELGTDFITEPVLGNWALAFALGLASSPYRLEGAAARVPGYGPALAALNARGVYVTPGTPIGTPGTTIERWNALSDSYWYAMTNNAVAAGLEHRFGATQNPTNFPQLGRVRLVARGTRFVCHLMTRGPVELPPWARLGKWMSKTRVERVRSWADPPRRRAPGLVATLQNAAELERSHRLGVFDLVAVPPVPLLGQVEVLEGELLDLGADGLLPAGLAFAVPPEPAAAPPARGRRRQ